MDAFDFIGPSDKPALVAVNDAERLKLVCGALESAGYKVHAALDAALFQARFLQISYEVVVLDQETDAAILEFIQTMPMAQRRHTTFVLLGTGVETLNAFQAYAQSVQCVVNYAQLSLIGRLIEKTVTEYQKIINPFLEVQDGLGKAAR
jgi:CheY-like chemotaxis protein